MLVAELSVTYSMLGEESDSFLLSLTCLTELDLEIPLLTSPFSVRLEELQMLYEDEVDEYAPVRMETQPTPLKGPTVGAKCCGGITAYAMGRLKLGPMDMEESGKG